MKKSPSLAPVILAGITVLGISTSLAQSDDFDDGNDVGWTRYEPLTGLGGPGGVYSFPDGNQYRIQALNNTTAALGPGRAGSIREDVSYTDFSVSYDITNWDDGLDQAFGALARVSQVGLGTTDGYAFTYATDGSIDISLVTDESSSELASAGITLSGANDYRFVFTGEGTTLTGAVYDLSDLSTPLDTITADDATYSGGLNGLFVFDNSGDLTGAGDATFDNYVAVVPEPSTLALSVLGALGLGAMACRRRSK
jgi:hypothetical protein